MRIAFVTFEYPPRIIGGAGSYAYEVCSRLGKAGHEVVIFIPRYKGDAVLELTEGVDAHYIDVSNPLPLSPQFWYKLPKAIGRRGPFDVVHLNSFNYFFVGRRLANCPHVMTIHHLAVDAHRASGWGILRSLRRPGSEDGFLMSIVERSCVRSMDAFFAVSQHSRQRAIDEYGLDPNNVHLTTNGTPLLEKRGASAACALRSRLGVPDGPLVIYVGRFEDRRKGVDVLLRAMRGSPPQANLLVVGRGDPSKLGSDIAELGLEGRVFFSGFLDDEDLASAYECADLCVVPSRMEGFSLTSIHAMAAGLPVLASDIGALREVVGDEEQLFPAGDHERLSSLIVEYLSNKELADAKGRRNTEWSAKFPTWDQVASTVESLYSKTALKPPIELGDAPTVDQAPQIRTRELRRS